MRWYVTILLSICLVIPANAFAQKEDKDAPPPMVKVAEVQLRNANTPNKYVGHVEARTSINLRARVDGYLAQVNFEEGTFVEKGQRLYTIEQGPYQARVASAQAKVAQAEADVFKSQNRLKRLQSAQSQSVPQTDMDDAKAAVDMAKGRLQEAEANLQTARINLNYTTIEAPISGRVGKSFFKEGDLVDPSSGPLAEVVSMDPIRVQFSVNEREVGALHQAVNSADSKTKNGTLPLRLQFTDKTTYPHNGTMEFMDNKMDPDTGTISAWASFANPDGRLIPGEYVNVLLPSGPPQKRPSVPQVAVQQDSDGAFVFVVDDESTVRKRQITTGESVADAFIVNSGLSTGERVVVEGVQKVAPGKRVTVRNAEIKDN
ncbi:MAG: efflux RND transporter periplasmic adaptor subunit [Thermodesulfobacteriota bacterium]